MTFVAHPSSISSVDPPCKYLKVLSKSGPKDFPFVDMQQNIKGLAVENIYVCIWILNGLPFKMF